jgi:hypothetical protein
MMAERFSLEIKGAILMAVCCLLASLVSVARADDKSQLTGHWTFNQGQSDDAAQKVQDAQQNSRVRAGNDPSTNPGGGGTYPGSGGGTYPGGGGGYPGGMGRGGMGGMGGMGGPGGGMGRGRQGMGNHETVSSEDWDRVASNPKYLRIDQRSDQVVVTDDSDHAQTFYPDGKKHDDKDADGKKVSTKTSWEGSVLVAETKLPHGEKLTETFRMSDDSKQLYVISRFEAPGLAGPVSIRRVYDLAKEQAR